MAEVGLNLLAVRATRRLGVERFVRDVVGSLRLREDHELLVATRRGVTVNDALGEEFILHNKVIRESTWYCNTTIWRIFCEMFLLCWKMFSCDVVFSINNFGPVIGKKGQRRIVVIHDVWFLAPGYEGGQIKKVLFKRLLQFQLFFATEVITVSNFSKRAIINYLGVSPSKISIVGNCIPEGRNLPVQTTAVGGGICSGKNKNTKFLLMVGSDRPNKNIYRGLRAYIEYFRSTPDPIKLVLVGTYSSHFREKLQRSIPSLCTDFISIPGFVSDDEYLTLMASCRAVIFPSTYEGFGIPVIEAVQARKRILIAKGSVCDELAGEAGVAVNVYDVQTIARGISDLVAKGSLDTVAEGASMEREKFDCQEAGTQLQAILVGKASA